MSKIKICGLTTSSDIAVVNQASPDYIGFVFAPSKRQIGLEQASTLKALLSPTIKAVGVFVNDSMAFIHLLWKEGIIDAVQLHGDEDERYRKTLKKSVPLPLIKAVRIDQQAPTVETVADYLLFDTYHKEQYGGTGDCFNWDLLDRLGPRTPPFFLAGGIHADNVGEALATANPYCVDISSGVETNGVKDPAKIIAIVNQVRRIHQDEAQ